MNVVRLLSIGDVDAHLMKELHRSLPVEFGARCEIATSSLNPAFAYHSNRQQYYSTEILAQMQRLLDGNAWRLLGITEVDLYIPILTFVFGEAQLNNPCAVVSTRRLRQEFYGLPPDAPLLRDRLLKEAVHELGHTLGLKHCPDYTCAMAASHAVEWIDLKGSTLCVECRAKGLPLPRAL